MKEKYSELKNLVEMGICSIVQSGKKYYTTETVKPSVLDKAIESYANGVSKDLIFGLIDTSLMSSGKEGMIFTNTAIYYRESFGKPIVIKYDEIKSMQINPSKSGKDYESTLLFTLLNNEKYKLSGSGYNKIPLKRTLESIKKLVEEGLTGDDDKIVALEAMEEPVKFAYMQVIVNYIKTGTINGKEIAELYSLMGQISLSPEYRMKLRAYLSDNDQDTNTILDNIDKIAQEGSIRVLHFSLIKDLIRVSIMSQDNDNNGRKMFIDKIAEKYDINQQQVSFFRDACNNDIKIISGEIYDSDIVKNSKELAAKATSLGVPVLAVYFSGSVVGLSAAGITSGLAALGLGGILGFSSMVTGIGVAITLGIGVYKGIKWVTAVGERGKSEKREFLIQQAIRNNQFTINNLVEDINLYAAKIVELMQQTEINSLRITKLVNELALFSNALASLKDKGISLDEVIYKKKEDTANE